MKRRIMLYYVVLVLIGMLLTGTVFSCAAQRFYKLEVEQNLIHTARMIHDHISHEASSGNAVDYDLLAKTYANILNQPQTEQGDRGILARVTFIDYGGKVLGESQTDYTGMENHKERKEIQQAIREGTGQDIRFSETLNINFLYVAVPLESSRIIVRVAVPLLKLRVINRAIWSYALIGILAGLVLTGFLAFKVSTSILSPIHQMISVSNKITAGSYSERVSVSSSDELGTLAETFNHMTDALEQNVLDLKEQNIKVNTIINSMSEGIVAVDTDYRIILINSVACALFGIENATDVTGVNILDCIRNHQINHLLRETILLNEPGKVEVYIGPPEEKILYVQANPIKPPNTSIHNSGGMMILQDVTNLKKLEKMRTEFVSNVTHELKTPLTSIRGFVETLRDGAVKEPEVAEKFLEIIDIEAERLYALINDILHLSEIESMDQETHATPCNLKSVMDEVLGMMRQAAEKKKVALHCRIKEDIWVTANKNRIKQMFINLIDNGIKYNVENGSITIQAYRAEGKAVIKITDTGIGIAEEHLPRIFERFYRVDKGRSRHMGGTGLGLSIVKHIVNLYHGDIKITSKPNHGTEFTIQLPV